MRGARWGVAWTLIVMSLAVGVSPTQADGEGGRVTPLANPVRVVDTRSPGPPNAGTQLTLGPGIHAVTALSTTSGTMSVRTCGTGASPADPFVFYEPGVMSTLRVARSDNACAYATSVVDLLVDRLADVSAAPQPAASQYVPLATTLTLLTGSHGPISSTTSLGPRPAALPADATAAVVSIEAVGATPGYLSIHRCGSAALLSDVVIPTGMAAAVDIVTLGPVDTLCLSGSTGGQKVDVHVELLGYLSPNGPDPLSLPPMYTLSWEPTPEPGFAPINPDRALDTRNGIGCIVEGEWCYEPDWKVGAGEVIQLGVHDYVWPWTTALSMNVTVTGPEGDGFLTVWPCDEARPNTSNLNWRAGETRANLVVAKFSADATTCLMSTVATHLIADITGVYDFEYGSAATGVAPRRLLDTRNAIGVGGRHRVAAGGVVTLKVTGRGGVPAGGVDAVTMNVTAVEPLGDGFLTIWPCDEKMPNASNVNYPPGRNVPNLVTVGVSAQGTVCLYSYAETHLLADVAAWYGSGGASGLVELSPKRILDTRNGVGAPLRKLQRDEVLTLQVRGRGGVAADATTVVMNTTITNPEGDGFLTVWPCDRKRPDASNLNFRFGDSVPNLVSVTLSAAGTVCMSANATTDVLADVAGYLTAKPTQIPTIVLR